MRPESGKYGSIAVFRQIATSKTYLPATIKEVVLDVSHNTVDTILSSSLLRTLTRPRKVRLERTSPAVRFRDGIGMVRPDYTEQESSACLRGDCPLV